MESMFYSKRRTAVTENTEANKFGGTPARADNGGLSTEPSKKAKKRSIVSKIFVYAMLILASIVMVMPLIILIFTSLKPYEELLVNPTAIFPKKFTLEAFTTVFSENPYFLYFGNSVFLTVINVVACCLTSAFVAYGFVRFRVRGAGLIFGVFLSGMLIPGQVLTIPMFEVYKNLNWINTFMPFIVPCWFGGGIFNIFLQRQFIRGIPSSLFEAAEIDGCNELEIFFTIVLRLVKPVMITIAIFTFMNNWNDLFGPLIYLDDPDLWTLAKGVYMIYQAEMGQMGSSGGSILPWNIISAANVFAIIPIVVLYFIAQRFFIEGISTTGLKE